MPRGAVEINCPETIRNQQRNWRGQKGAMQQGVLQKWVGIYVVAEKTSCLEPGTFITLVIKS